MSGPCLPSIYVSTFPGRYYSIGCCGPTILVALMNDNAFSGCQVCSISLEPSFPEPSFPNPFPTGLLAGVQAFTYR